LIDDIGEASLAGRLAQGANDEALSAERMGWIRDLDRVRLWVLEAGIKRWLLSTLWIMPTCGNSSGEGYVTGQCYD
jgi:hypothetical protein